MVRLLRDQGVISATEWTTALRTRVGGQISEVQYQHWLAALEQVLEAKGLVPDDTLQRHRLAWSRAARRTPHGEPITLAAKDFPD
jgi:hypothetical protein